MWKSKEKSVGLETFYEEGRKQARIHLYGRKEEGEYALCVYERWISQPDFYGEEWNDKKYAFVRGWTHQMMD